MTTTLHTYAIDQMATSIGTMLLVSDDRGRLRALDWSDCEERMQRLLRLHYGRVELRAAALPIALRSALEHYFAGDLRALEGIPVCTAGTPFQRRAWAALRAIPAGQTRSYGAQASAIGAPSAVRAVGLANGANPVGLVIPCHRVIGADGSLTGYAGGLARKRWLLAHEGARCAARSAA